MKPLTEPRVSTRDVVWVMGLAKDTSRAGAANMSCFCASARRSTKSHPCNAPSLISNIIRNRTDRELTHRQPARHSQHILMYSMLKYLSSLILHTVLTICLIKKIITNTLKLSMLAQFRPIILFKKLLQTYKNLCMFEIPIVVKNVTNKTDDAQNIFCVR